MDNTNKPVLKRAGKRPFLVDSDSEDEIRAALPAESDSWPRFLVVESSDPTLSLSKISPFVIQKWFAGISGSITNVKRLRDASFLVEAPTKRVSDMLLKRNGTLCVDREVKVVAHRTLNSCKGVIRCRELESMSEIEIRDEMKHYGVTDVHRVMVTRDGKKVPTNTYFFTFCLAKLPESVNVGYLRVRVTAFVPSPMRCFKCHRFGHTSKLCKSETEMCVRCGQPSHDGGCATKCINCTGSHTANSKECPKLKVEQDIQRVRTVERCSFPEARKKVMATMPNTSTPSFAQATASTASSKSLAGSAVDSALVEQVKALAEMICTLVNRIAALEARLAGSRPGSAPTTKENRPAPAGKPSGQTAPLKAVNPVPPPKPPQTSGLTAPPNAVTSKGQTAPLKAVNPVPPPKPPQTSGLTAPPNAVTSKGSAEPIKTANSKQRSGRHGLGSSVGASTHSDVGGVAVSRESLLRAGRLVLGPGGGGSRRGERGGRRSASL